MNTSGSRSILAVTSLALLLALGACNRAGERTANERGEAAKSSQQGAAPSSDATANGGSAADADTHAMGSAGAKPIDDSTITAQVNAALNADKEVSALRIDVDTQNGVVTLSGPAPTVTAKEHAGEVARSVHGVTSVNNQLTLKSS
jgi:hypothetical protein